MNICLLCQKPYDAVDTIMEQRLVEDTQFCKICFAEFIVEEYDSNFLSTIR